jgi:transcriptional regulator with XRE-family HTH domain
MTLQEQLERQELASCLRDLREVRGLTLADAVERAGDGLSLSGLSRLERGDRSPSIGSLRQLARAYGIRFVFDAEAVTVETAPEMVRKIAHQEAPEDVQT